MTHFVNPKQIPGDLVPHLVELTGAGPIIPSNASAMSN